MKVGVLKEIKSHEHRVALTPSGAGTLTQDGHEVWVEHNAGLGSGFTNQEFEQAGARIIDSAKQVWDNADLALKVKEPVESEYQFLRDNLTLFTFLHLANEPALGQALLDAKCTGIAYETVQIGQRNLPLLKPMSEVAGRMAVQIGANCLRKDKGGRGVMLSGLPGVEAGQVTVLGAGVVGMNAIKMAVGLGAQVRVLDLNVNRLEYIDDLYHGRVITQMSSHDRIETAVRHSDLVIGAVLIAGAKAPKLVTAEMVKSMRQGSVILDVSVDQGGCVETCHPTTHDNPTYEVDGVIHYCVTNIPGTVSRTSTLGLTNVTFPYVRKLAKQGTEQALKNDDALAKGLNTHQGKIMHPAVAEALNS